MMLMLEAQPTPKPHIAIRETPALAQRIHADVEAGLRAARDLASFDQRHEGGFFSDTHHIPVSPRVPFTHTWEGSQRNVSPRPITDTSRPTVDTGVQNVPAQSPDSVSPWLFIGTTLGGAGLGSIVAGKGRRLRGAFIGGMAGSGIPGCSPMNPEASPPAFVTPASENTKVPTAAATPFQNEALTASPEPPAAPSPVGVEYPRTFENGEAARVYTYSGAQGRSDMVFPLREYNDRYMAEMAREGLITGATIEDLYASFDANGYVMRYFQNAQGAWTFMPYQPANSRYLVAKAPDGAIFPDLKLPLDKVISGQNLVDQGTDDFDFYGITADGVQFYGGFPVFVRTNADGFVSSVLNAQQNFAEVVVAATPDASSTPTEAAQETAAEALARRAEFAVESGWDANNPATWTSPAGVSTQDAQFYQDMIRVNGGPNTANEQSVVAHDEAFSALQRAQMRATFFEGEVMNDNAKAAIADYLTSNNVSIQPPEAVYADRVAFETWLSQLSNSEATLLMKEWCNQTGQEYMPSVASLWEWLGGFNDGLINETVLYSSIVNDKGQVVDGSVFNGMWFQGDPFLSTDYPIQTILGKDFKLKASRISAEHWVFVDAAIRLPYGQHGVLWRVVGADGASYYLPTVVVYDTQPVLKGYIDASYAAQGIQKDASANMTTRLLSDYGTNQARRLALNDILTAAKLNKLALIRSQGTTFSNQSGSALFVEPQTGLSIVGTSDAEISGTNSGVFITP